MKEMRLNCRATCHQSGFSLVEILIGLTIGLIGAIAMFSVVTTFEKQKRTTISRSESQAMGGAALLTVGQELRLAGFGFGETPFLNCVVQAFDGQRPVGSQDFNFSFVPVLITQGAAGAPDSIRITYSDSNFIPVGQPFTQPVAAPADFKVNNRAGFNAGDILVAAENIAGVPTCTLEEVTQTPTTVGQTDMLIHNTGSYTNPHGQSIVSRFNKVGGLGVVHTSGTLYDLGPQPRSNSYQIEGGNHLTVIDQLHFFDGNADGVNDSVELSDEVIDLQAQYGVDTNNDGVVVAGEFQDAAPANWALLRAVRLAVLVRSPNWERDQVTTVAPSWSGGNFVMSDPDANTIWQNYRYRVYETIVPLRNMIWGQ